MAATGLQLSETVLSSLQNTGAGIGASMINIGMPIIAIGLGVFGIMFVLNKVLRMFKSAVN